MRGAWLDDDDQVGRHARRHDGAAHGRHTRSADVFDDPDWIPPSQRGSRSVDTYHRRAATHDEFAPAPDKHKAHQHALPAAAQPAPGWVPPIAGIGALFGLGVIIAGGVGDSDMRTAAVVMLVLVAIGMPILKKLSEGRRDIQQILYAGLGFKIVMTVARFYLATGGYYKNSDAYGYDFYGRQVATDFLRHGHMPGWKSYTGTSFIRLITGFVYTIMPASEFAAFFVFAAFSFAGALLFWRAVKLFTPNGGDRPYLMMLMFIPSFVYWPSALGKEAWIILMLGLATFGFAKILTGGLISGVLTLGGGVYGMTMVRPHVGVAVMIGLVIATVFAKQQGRRIGMVVMVGVLIVMGGFVLSKANQFFKSDVTNASDVSTQLTAAGKRTTQGGSEFTPSPVSPQNFPMAVVTVLIRPFPWESSSVPELATALESVIIAWLIIKGFKGIRGRIRRDNPIAIYALVVTLVFVVLFWNFGNFGILARQRTQIAPFMFLLLTMPTDEFRARKEARRAKRSGDKAWADWDALRGGTPEPWS